MKQANQMFDAILWKSYFEIWDTMAQSFVILPDKSTEIKTKKDSIDGNSLTHSWHLIKILFSSYGSIIESNK